MSALSIRYGFALSNAGEQNRWDRESSHTEEWSDKPECFIQEAPEKRSKSKAETHSDLMESSDHSRSLFEDSR